MRGLDWKTPAIALVLFFLLFPYFRKSAETSDQKIVVAKKRLLLSKDLIAHRDDYILMRKELEVRGESLWGSTESGDFLAEVQAVSKELNMNILNLRNATGKIGGQDLLAVEVEIQGTMAEIGGFLYRSLRLPGLVTLEKLALTPGRDGTTIEAQFLLSRKTAGLKSGNLIT